MTYDNFSCADIAMQFDLPFNHLFQFPENSNSKIEIDCKFLASDYIKLQW